MGGDGILDEFTTWDSKLNENGTLLEKGLDDKLWILGAYDWPLDRIADECGPSDNDDFKLEDEPKNREEDFESMLSKEIETTDRTELVETSDTVERAVGSVEDGAKSRTEGNGRHGAQLTGWFAPSGITPLYRNPPLITVVKIPPKSVVNRSNKSSS